MVPSPRFTKRGPWVSSCHRIKTGAGRVPVALRGPPKGLHVKTNFLRRINVICPVQICFQINSASRSPQITITTPAIPLLHKGRFAIVTDVGRGAVDAGGAADESADLRTAKSCGPDASTPASSFAELTPRGDGDKKARSPGRARRKPLKPLRRECRVMPV